MFNTINKRFVEAPQNVNCLCVVIGSNKQFNCYIAQYEGTAVMLNQAVVLESYCFMTTVTLTKVLRGLQDGFHHHLEAAAPILSH